MKFYNNMQDNKCSNCGNCCGNILPLTEVEISIIQIYMRENQIQKVYNSQKHTCPFRDEAHKQCAIYEARPFICRMWRCDGKMTPKQNKQLTKVKRLMVDMRAYFFGGKASLTQNQNSNQPFTEHK